ncbi:hypothetical protein OMP40_01865 [Cohnella rhizosphaerae]|uniref:Uncharacterized protein n=1 Tax=Cohnella rhizosphaerae TaxID=1457232 RepID=A0A9X4KT61_9BACL|nr:hypothetical protein [Cohnella rhizosphaerae]MDG0808299.1 hypothetical protein [Cohnella rhizosphaerae]
MSSLRPCSAISLSLNPPAAEIRPDRDDAEQARRLLPAKQCGQCFAVLCWQIAFGDERREQLAQTRLARLPCATALRLGHCQRPAADCLVLAQHAADDPKQVVALDRLDEIVPRAEPQRFFGEVELLVRRDDDDRQMRLLHVDRLHQLDAAHAAHLNIRQDQVERLHPQVIDRFEAVQRRLHMRDVQLRAEQEIFDARAHSRLVVDDQYFVHVRSLLAVRAVSSASDDTPVRSSLSQDAAAVDDLFLESRDVKSCANKSQAGEITSSCASRAMITIAL